MAITTGKTRFTLQKLIDKAIGRCKISRQLITAEHQQIAKDCLSLVLADLSNKTVPLWCQERLLLPVYMSESTITLPQGTIDILPESAFYRTCFRVGDSYISAEGTAAYAGDGDFSTSCDQVSVDGTIAVQFLTPTIVTQVGILPDGDNWYNLSFEVSLDGLSWTLIQSIAPPYGENATLYQDARWTWYELTSPPSTGVLFFRVRETSGGVLKLRELYLGNTPNDIPLARMNREQYLTMPNKAFQGRPLQFWLNRETDVSTGEVCQIVTWPVAGVESKFAQIYCMRSRYVADLTDYNQGIEVPTRWYDALIWQLASYIAAEYPEVPQEREVYLIGMAKAEMGEALDEERDNSPIMIQPNIGAYTR